MPRYIAFLRAINVGGRVVKMEDLRALFEAMKFARVETFIASGNVIFENGVKDAGVLAAKIEGGLRKALGYEVATFLRTDVELGAIVQYQPFDPAAVEAAATLCVGFLAAPLSAELAQKVAGLSTTEDTLHVHGSEVYWLGQKKQSESVFSGAVLEKALGVRATFRGMSTVRKLAAKFPPRQ